MQKQSLRIALGAVAGVVVGLVATGRASAQLNPGADVTYLRTDAVTNWGAVGGIRGYSLGSYTCNMGNQSLDWGPPDIESGQTGWTPALAMNAYRLHQGRLEQIGMSWVKNGTTAAAGSGCGFTCSGPGNTWLGPGCRDVYGSSYNGGQGILGPRSAVNPVSGSYSGVTGGSGNVIYKRLQIAETDLTQAGALYFVEGQYVAWDDAADGNAMNNASYKRVTVNTGTFAITPVDVQNNIQKPAIYAWQEHGNGVNQPDPSVNIVTVDVFADGRFYVASKATDLGNGTWRYDYGVFNFNSDRAGGSLIVPVPSGVSRTNTGFHDVAYHSGEPYSPTDWPVTLDATDVRWDTPEPFAQNANANALRWGTLYNYWFTADTAPVAGQVTIGLFKPGAPNDVLANAHVPGPPVPPPCPVDTNGDGTVNVLDVVAVILNWGCTTCPGEDVNDDGVVDVGDLVDVTLGWGDCR